MNAEKRIAVRKGLGHAARILFLISTILAVMTLIVLLFNIVNNAFGLVAYRYSVDPASLTRDSVPLEKMSEAQLAGVLTDNITKGLYRKLDSDKPVAERTREDLLGLIFKHVANLEIVEAHTLVESLFGGQALRDRVLAEDPKTVVEFRSWVSLEFIANSQSSQAGDAGIRTALLGSLLTIVMTILFAFPIGLGAAIYLEEYAKDNFINRIIQVNIYNLAGIPSIIYGLLGLVVFVRFLEPLTSGSFLGLSEGATANGRTIMSAGLTLALLVLPVIIINSQEAIKAVPNSIRLSSYGLGATKWQTIRHHILPNSFDRILTGMILAVSRAIGETAPLVVVGASTYIAKDPSGFFSKFTTMTIQIYQWTARPQAEFRSVAAAGIIVLVLLLITLNMSAIIMRNRISAKRRG